MLCGSISVSAMFRKQAFLAKTLTLLTEMSGQMLKIELELTETDQDMLKSMLDREYENLKSLGLENLDALPTIMLCEKICLACTDAQDMQTAEMN